MGDGVPKEWIQAKSSGSKKKTYNRSSGDGSFFSGEDDLTESVPDKQFIG